MTWAAPCHLGPASPGAGRAGVASLASGPGSRRLAKRRVGRSKTVRRTGDAVGSPGAARDCQLVNGREQSEYVEGGNSLPMRGMKPA